MNKNAVIVLSVIEHKKPIKLVCQEFEVSRSWVYELLRRHRILGPAAFEKGSKRPHGNSLAISLELHQEIAKLRLELKAQGFDAGAQSIQFRLQTTYGHAPSLSTIWRSAISPRKSPSSACSALRRYSQTKPGNPMSLTFSSLMAEQLMF
jgi:hypothetical protein